MSTVRRCLRVIIRQLEPRELDRFSVEQPVDQRRPFRQNVAFEFLI